MSDSSSSTSFGSAGAFQNTQQGGASRNTQQGGDSLAQTGRGILDKVRETATGQLANQKDRATEGLGSVAQFVRQSTQQLRDQKQEGIAAYVEQAADQIDQFSQSLRNKDVSELLDDAQQLARRQPALFIGGAFLLGLVGARFLKSSAQANGGSSRRGNGSGASRFGGTRQGTGQTGYGSAAGSFNSGPGAGQYGGTSSAAGDTAITPGGSPQTGRF
jgi:hypothetical protein